MKKMLLILFTSLFISLSTIAQDKRITVTIDDLPVASTLNYLEKKEITEKLLSVLSNNKVPAIGFVNEIKLYHQGNLDSLKVELLVMWLEAGLELGNHTYSHPNYHEVGYEIFTKDVLKGEKVIKPISQNYNKSVKYFRHPYLKSGASKSSSDSLKNFLNQNNYIEAPVTIDNEDYIFAAAYEKAFKANDLSLMKNIGSAYINYTASKTLYYEMLAEEIFGKEIPHILLIHANKLNADYFDELYMLYEQNGYEFTTLDIVLKDESYRESVTRFGDWGISWLERWALSKRVGMDILKDAPSIPNFAHN